MATCKALTGLAVKGLNIITNKFVGKQTSMEVFYSLFFVLCYPHIRLIVYEW